MGLLASLQPQLDPEVVVMNWPQAVAAVGGAWALVAFMYVLMRFM